MLSCGSTTRGEKHIARPRSAGCLHVWKLASNAADPRLQAATAFSVSPHHEHEDRANESDLISAGILACVDAGALLWHWPML